jgi:cytidine deaminase
MTHFNKMFALAKDALANSYSPYSRFPVGVCVRTSSDQFFIGANYENACYAEGICAEGVAIGSMIVSGEREIAEVLVVSKGKQFTAPCGACMQRITEFADASVNVHMSTESGEVCETSTVGELLPFGMRKDNLEIQ